MPTPDATAGLLDVIIVGGGPAGLSAALILGRCLRRVLVCDAGQPRNAASHAMHGYLTERIVFQDGSENLRRALFFSPGQHPQSPLAKMLGCEFCEADGCVQCAENASTCVPGVFVAGNASRGLQLVIAAAAEGMQAGFAINCALLEADAEKGAVKSGAGDEKHPAPIPK